MIYNLILYKQYDKFAVVKIPGVIKRGDNIRFRSMLYKIIDIEGDDIFVLL